MPLRTTRIAPVPEPEWTPEVRELIGARMGSGRASNLYTTLVRHPDLLKRWLVFASHVLGASTLPARARELLILRTGYRCKSDYEWGQHAYIARMIGISDEEILRIAKGPDALGWDPFDATLLRAADELHDDHCVSDATWAALSTKYDEKQLIDLVFTVGQYTLVSMVLNTLGIAREDGVEAIPT